MILPLTWYRFHWNIFTFSYRCRRSNGINFLLEAKKKYLESTASTNLNLLHRFELFLSSDFKTFNEVLKINTVSVRILCLNLLGNKLCKLEFQIDSHGLCSCKRMQWFKICYRILYDHRLPWSQIQTYGKSNELNRQKCQIKFGLNNSSRIDWGSHGIVEPRSFSLAEQLSHRTM